MPRHIPFDLSTAQAVAAHATRVKVNSAVALGKGAVVVGIDSEGVERTFEASTLEIKGSESSERVIMETAEGWKSLHTYKVSKVVI